MNKLKIYLAGPEVFLPEVKEIGNQKKELCDKYGFVGIFPFDNEMDNKQSDRFNTFNAFSIYSENKKYMDECDVIIANLTPFRGVSADSGTVFELAYMIGKNKRYVLGYTNKYESYRERVHKQYYIDGDCDNNGMYIENYNMNDNLMVDCGIRMAGGVFHIWRNPIKPLPENNLFTELSVFELCLDSLKKRIDNMPK